MRRSSGDAGNALLGAMTIVVICGALAGGVLLPNMARHSEAVTMVNRERAFQMAEAGIDFAVAEVRQRNGNVTGLQTTRTSVSTLGEFSVSYGPGVSNGRDEDGDGLIDEPDEGNFVVLVSTGTAGDISRSIEVLLRRSVVTPSFTASIQFNVETPVVDLNGNSFTIAGEEHLIDGTRDDTRPALSGLSSPGPAADLAAQIDAGHADQITGSGGSPSVATTDPIDLALLVEQAKSAATTVLEPGTHSSVDFGTPQIGHLEVVYCGGDLKLTGNGSGAGVLVVDGDLDLAGGFLWTGIVLVRGAVNMVGGGSGKRLIGAVVIGEEISSNTGSSEVRVTGTVDLLYSTDAVALAQQRLAIMSVLSWREVGSP